MTPSRLFHTFSTGVATLQRRLTATLRRLKTTHHLHEPQTPLPTEPASPSLHTLTAAALALPGLTAAPATAATDDDAYLHYGTYWESERRQLEKYSTLRLKPMQVDSVAGGARLTLKDRLKLAFNYAQDTWSGATPLTTLPAAAMHMLESGASMAPWNTVYLDKQLRSFYRLDESSGNLVRDDRKVHMMTMASPETRKQGDFKLSYEWDKAALDLGGGVSVEDDYDSYFVNTHGRWDFNRKLTTLNAGLSYTRSNIDALRDPSDNHVYIDYGSHVKSWGSDGNLRDERQDGALTLGLTQVLNKNAVVEGGFNYTHSAGFLGNPYKVAAFLFVDPKKKPDPVNGLLSADIKGVLERRPTLRNQFTWNLRYVQYVPTTDASLNLDYRFFHDDWGINAHTFEASWGQPLAFGWTITPRFRYYSQDQADFYQPFFLFHQAMPTAGTGIDFGKIGLKHFSSDHRLSGFGALSGGMTLGKHFAKGVDLEAGFEYYTHESALKLGKGGSAGRFADYDSWIVSAALKVDLSALSFGGGGHEAHAGHPGHAGHGGHAAHAPAGVMFDHMLDRPGDFMVGYRYMYHRENGDMLHGTRSVSDAVIARRGCGKIPCTDTPIDHAMHMHMVDLMYAPTDWLNLMLMPQFVDMNMKFRTLGSGAEGSHATGGVGDLGMYALVKLFDLPGHHLHLSLGGTAPTGDVTQKLTGGGHHHGGGGSHQGLIHYGMQLGSGTWDFRPSLSYSGQRDRWSWGAQLSGIKRLENRNESGYALGDEFQSTAWGSYSLTDWLSASLRGVYTEQDAIRGQFKKQHPQSGPMDFPFNYGGRFVDVGFGLNAVVPSGSLKGNRLSIEWLQPVRDDVNGYQLQREGALSASWGLAF